MEEDGERILPQRHRGTDIDELNEVTEKIIGCAIEVHRHLGPGLLEHVYEEALCVEFDLQGLRYHRQVTVPVNYKGRLIAEYRLDLLVEDTVVVEIKSVERYDPVFAAQVLTYLRVTGKKVGLLINFNSKLLKEGVKRFIL
ncbi:MAG: GxxExxY protein [Anaerolineae bacterium]